MEAGSVQAIFERQAARTPQAIALAGADGGEISYQELNARANRLAHYLRERGAAHGALVGVCLRRSPEAVIALVAILKAGGAYVPLDPDYPRERIAFMLEDTGAGVVVTDRACAEVLPPAAAKLVLIDGEREAIGRESDRNPAIAAAPDDLIYVMYTSGSTGRPKGVLVEHRGVLRLVQGADYAAFDAAQRFLLLSPLAFDAATFEIWGALLNGATVVVAPAGTLSVADLGEIIQRHGVTTIFLTTALFNLMVEHQIEDLRGVRQILTGGEAASREHFRKAVQELPDCEVIHCYGPTETTTFATTMRITAGDLVEGAPPIGFPINRTQIYLLDDKGKPVGAAESGELCISGDGVARGYLNRPEVTAEKFVRPAWLDDGVGAIYRSGDRARRRADGALEFLGRFDDQVKISGYRIEPGEVAAILREYPGVSDASVIVDGPSTGTKRLLAYVVARRAERVEAGELRAFVATRLPRYMMPAAFTMLAALPLNANGKIDRAALPRPEAGQVEAGEVTESARPAGEMERRVAAIWREVLRISEVGVNDNFFDVGGDSLRLMEVHARLQKELGCQLRVTELFQYATIAAIARKLTNQAGSAAPDDLAAERARRQKELLSKLPRR
ncbi:MAG TPA: non-ribosomal peptide synthetase [Candidatus Binataceae bacterium]|nr:non-ribosomal peptide synthetase [Candidatus Binataceae bacterium]